MNSMKHMVHTFDREKKRENARDRAQRVTMRGEDLLHDGIEEAVFAHHDPDEYALPRDCEAEAYAINASDAAIDALRDALTNPEPLMADWEVALLTGLPAEECSTIAWSSMNYDYEREREREIERQRFLLSLEADEDDEPTDWHGSEVWPPAVSMHDIEENHGYFSRGFIITDRP